MNILIVGDPSVSLRNPKDASKESFIVELANTLVKKGYSVDVIAKESDERNLFGLIAFPESVFSMKDDSYRPSTELQGQRYYQTLQYGRMDAGPYDIIHYISYVPEIYELAALKHTPSVMTFYASPSKKFTLMYGMFLKQTHAMAVTMSEDMRIEWLDAANISPNVITNGPNKADEYIKLYEHVRLGND